MQKLFDVYGRLQGFFNGKIAAVSRAGLGLDWCQVSGIVQRGGKTGANILTSVTKLRSFGGAKQGVTKLAQILLTCC